jgi:phage terminase large subunit-like protein
MPDTPSIYTNRGALPPVLRELGDADLQALEREQRRAMAENSFALFKPYPKQAAFFGAGRGYRERALMGGNQTGKSISAAYEAAAHLTGNYPAWWQGRRFERAVTGWAGGMTSAVVRDTVQARLLGPGSEHGTGMVPKRALKGVSPSRGVSGAADVVEVAHVSGGTSRLSFKSYEEGREKWQGATLDFVALDEEPPADLYAEALTRTAASGGIVFATFTPLLGMSEVVMMFYPRPASPDRHLVQMTIDDAEHFGDEQRQRVVAGYRPHERDARARGIPLLGGGAIVQIPESDWIGPTFTMPREWPGLIGIDLGYDHPFGAVLLRHDRDADVVHVTQAFRVRQRTPRDHAEVLRGWGNWPVAWPHDGASHDRGAGEQIAQLYRNFGLDMLFQHATHPSGGFGLEASIADVLDRMQTRRLIVADHLVELREELRMWHRKDGKVVRENDDLISALRYALMSLRFARLGAAANDGWHHVGPLRRNIRIV